MVQSAISVLSADSFVGIAPNLLRNEQISSWADENINHPQDAPWSRIPLVKTASYEPGQDYHKDANTQRALSLLSLAESWKARKIYSQNNANARAIARFGAANAMRNYIYIYIYRKYYK